MKRNIIDFSSYPSYRHKKFCQLHQLITLFKKYIYLCKYFTPCVLLEIIIVILEAPFFKEIYGEF